jgi:hypothetical protein
MVGDLLGQRIPATARITTMSRTTTSAYTMADHLLVYGYPHVSRYT